MVVFLFFTFEFYCRFLVIVVKIISVTVGANFFLTECMYVQSEFTHECDVIFSSVDVFFLWFTVKEKEASRLIHDNIIRKKSLYIIPHRRQKLRQ